ncbi:MAG: SDR family oxidoreductase [Burkholderiales bacterium]|nr:SDR family oxidoreductase [Burkholderiales bacterium]
MPARPHGAVLVTGASDGLGAALAHCYAGRGIPVALLARRAAALERLALEYPGLCSTHAADVRDAAAMRDAAAAIAARHGLPDIVIANAGVSVGTLTEEAGDESAFRDVFDTNVLGLVHSFQPHVAAMRERGHGVLVGIASVAGYRGIPGAGAYSASKAAAINYLESLRVELRGSGVTVITICPGYIATAMTAVNPYRMPFMMTAETAAQKIAGIIDARKTHAVLPWQMAVIARLMHVLPQWAYDPLAARAGRKPRRGG